MRDMEEARRRARRCVVFCALYMAAASLLTVWDLMIPLVFAPMVGLICTAECFDAGRCYQFSLYYGEDESEEELIDAMEWMDAATGVKAMKCEKCNGMAFRMVAGRFVCNTCGEVMGVEYGERET